MENVPDQEDLREESAQPAAVEETKKTAAYGSVLGIVLIVAILVAGAFYVWNERLEMSQPMVPTDGVRGGDAQPDFEDADAAFPGDAGAEAEAELDTPQPQ